MNMNPEDLDTNKWRLVSYDYHSCDYHGDDYKPLLGNSPLEWDAEFNASDEFVAVAKRMNIERLEAQLGGPIENIGAPEDADRIGLVL